MFHRMTVVSFGEYGEVDKTWETGMLSLYLSQDEVCILEHCKLVKFMFSSYRRNQY